MYRTKIKSCHISLKKPWSFPSSVGYCLVWIDIKQVEHLSRQPANPMTPLWAWLFPHRHWTNGRFKLEARCWGQCCSCWSHFRWFLYAIKTPSRWTSGRARAAPAEHTGVAYTDLHPPDTPVPRREAIACSQAGSINPILAIECLLVPRHALWDFAEHNKKHRSISSESRKYEFLI